MTYLVLKHVHMSAAGISLLLFVLRGYWMMIGSSRLNSRFSRVVPHIVDTLLLASAIALSVIVQQYPFVQTWLTAKLIGLVVYIFLGLQALRYGRTRTIRIAAFLAAVAVFLWIGATALRHAPALFA